MGLYFPYCDDGIGVCCNRFGKKLLNLVHGLFRLIVFLFAWVPFLTTAYVVRYNYKTYLSGYSAAASGFYATWNIIRMAMELIVCMAVMTDTIVSTDTPFGFNVNRYSFLYLTKITPSIVRGVLWLLLSGFSSKEILNFASKNYNQTTFALVSVVVDTGRKLLIIPATFWIIFNIVRFRQTLFTLEVGLTPRTTEGLEVNHWHMTRYYERKSWYQNIPKQRIKHRLEKVLFVISPIIAIASYCFKFYLDYSIIVSTTPNISLILPSSFSTEVKDIVTKVLYYIDLIVPYLVHVLISILLIVYIFILMCMKKFIPFHWMIKALMFYNLIATIPSKTTLETLAKTVNLALSAEVALWLSACVPLLVFLPAIPYFLTRSPSMLCQEITGIFKNFLQVCLNFIHPSKVYRVFHILSIIFGICGLLFLLLGLPLTWLNTHFDLDVNMQSLASLHTNLDVKMLSIKNKFENVLGSMSCVPLGDTIDNKATLTQLQTDNAECFDGSDNSSRCVDVVTAYNSALDTTNYDNKCISDDIICAAFMTMIIAGFIVATTPFTGGAGKAMVLAARTMKKMHGIMKTLQKVRSKVITYKSLLTKFAKVLQKVTLAVVFVVTSEILFIILPCLALGAICLSVGFFIRRPIEGVFSRSMLTFVSIAFVVTNVPIGLFVWFAAPLLQGVLDVAPLFTVTVEEQTGWQLIKAAYICSAFSSLLMWIYSTGDFILSLLTRLFCGCTCCGKCVASCRRYAESEDVEKDTTNPDAEINEDIEMEDTRDLDLTEDDDKTLVDTEQPIATTETETDTVSSEEKEKIKQSLVLTKIARPSAWFMPLVPAIFAGLLVAYIIVFQPSMYIIYTRLNGETRSLESEVSVGSERVSDGADTMDNEKTLCDLITAAVTAPFSALFDALTPSIVTDITAFVVKMKSVFSIPVSVSLSGWGHFIFSGLPGLASFLFILGFLITLSPCCSDFIKSLILSQIKQFILIILLAALSFSLTASMAITRLLESLPLVEINAEYGLAIQLSLLANFILLLGWVELNISEYAPII